jgi:superfamily I DNA and/or RNA helicase
MFSVANQIAYQGSMVQNVLSVQGKSASCWYHVVGEVKDRHYVPEQGEFVVEWIRKYVKEHRVLPDIYIISPFRKVKERIGQLILKEKLAPRERLAKWVEGRVGTVHTFQGKEEEALFLVLGGDSMHQGAAAWASAKPNLLNVALTRAKKSVYVVGDVNLWGNRPYFKTLREAVAVIQVIK